MIKSASLVLIAGFWLVMNGLLWRAEFGSGTKGGVSVPAELVWEKILSAPDDSALGISAQGKKVGFLRIRPRVNEAGSEGKIASENEPEGMVRKATEYSVQFEGSLVVPAVGRSVRFESEVIFDLARHWKTFAAAAFVRPNKWEIRGNAAQGDIWFQSTDGESEWIHRFTADDLRKPERVLALVDSPLVAALLPQYLNAMVSTNSARAGQISLPALDWKANYEWLQIGQNRVRIYRLEARLFDRHRIVVLVSRVGEILRIELPGDVKLVNEVLYAS